MSLAVGSAGLEGFALSIGLILALGPQNIFVLRQGLTRSHVFVSCLVCSLADASLIAAGVLGVGSILSEIEGAQLWISLGAAAFLIGYGILRVLSSMNPEGIEIGGEGEGSLRVTIWSALAFTFLNPHVYLDTLLLIGGASSRFVGDEKIAFGLGAMVASFVFFFSLGYGARRLSVVLNRPESWKIIDLSMAFLMFGIAGSIIFSQL